MPPPPPAEETKKEMGGRGACTEAGDVTRAHPRSSGEDVPGDICALAVGIAKQWLKLWQDDTLQSTIQSSRRSFFSAQNSKSTAIRPEIAFRHGRSMLCIAPTERGVIACKSFGHMPIQSIDPTINRLPIHSSIFLSMHPCSHGCGWVGRPGNSWRCGWQNHGPRKWETYADMRPGPFWD